MRRLSREDLDDIRAIVREEIEAALGRGDIVLPEPPDSDRRPVSLEVRAHLIDSGFHTDLGDLNEEQRSRVRHRVRELRAHREELDRRRAAREAIPIPDTPFIDLYDARRLLNQATGVTANAWMKRGRLKRHRIDGQLRFSRAEVDEILAANRRNKK